MRRGLQNLILSLASVAFALGASELGLRVLGFENPYTAALYPKAMHDGASPSGLRAGFVGSFPHSEIHGRIAINSKGLRDVEHSYERAGGPRILALGDSFSFGHGVELQESYLALLEQELRRAHSPRTEIVKAGAPGTDPATYLRFYGSEGWKYRPDLVLVSVFVGNDLLVRRQPGPAGASPSSRRRVGSFKTFLRNNSVFYAVVVDRLKSVPAIRGLLNRTGIAHGVIGEEVILVLKKEYDAHERRRFEETLSLLDQLRSAVPAIALVIIPTREQVDAVRLGVALRVVGFSRDQVDPELPNRRLREFCAARGIPCIDLLQAFRARHASVPMYGEVDAHFSLAGNAAAAQEVARGLEPLLASLELR